MNAGMRVVAILTTVPSNQLRHRPLIRDFRDVTIRPEGDHLKVDVREATSFLDLVYISGAQLLDCDRVTDKP